MLSKENLEELRHNLAHLSLPAVRNFYDQAYQDCRLFMTAFQHHARYKLLFRFGNSCGSGVESEASTSCASLRETDETSGHFSRH